MRKPDFERLKNTLFCKKTDAIPIAELFHDIEVMDSLMGHEVNTTEDEINFYTKFGYDYFPVAMTRWLTGVKGPEQEIQEQKAFREMRRNRRQFSYSETEDLKIANLDDFRSYDWCDHTWLRGGGDLSYFDYVAERIPEGMKIIAWTDGIYEFFPKYIGYERFCYGLYDDITFIEEVLAEVGRRAVESYERVLAHPSVGAVWLADDIGYTEGLLWSPDLMRKYLFPWYKKIGASAEKHKKPFIFHSDGKLWEVLPDLLDAGIRAIQPIEPKSWSPVEIKDKYGDRVCIMGTIDLDLICRGTREEVVRYTKDHIDSFRHTGGFVVGTSNTPTYYMNMDNYKAVLETALSYG